MQLLYLLKDKQVAELDAAKLRSYFLYCVKTLQLSKNTLHKGDLPSVLLCDGVMEGEVLQHYRYL